MRLGFMLTFGALLFLTGGAGAQVKKHPHHHLHHALWELRDARKELKESKHDFGGHKEKALHAINDAIKQLELVLLYKNDNIKGEPTRGDLREHYKKYKHHPHLHHALHELQHAQHQLKEAKHNFNGHRERALRDIHTAIHQIELLLKHHKK
ncbi:MAG: hypothetical protein FJ303_05910 [Planctomycetes bacterium]|nr:hypothetical protein [Planctomycetota bacterium]